MVCNLLVDLAKFLWHECKMCQWVVSLCELAFWLVVSAVLHGPVAFHEITVYCLICEPYNALANNMLITVGLYFVASLSPLEVCHNTRHVSHPAHHMGPPML